MKYSYDSFKELINNSNLRDNEKTAVFDFDGTLIIGDIEEAFFCYLLSKNYQLEYSWEEYNHQLEIGEYKKAYLDMKKSFSNLTISNLKNEINNFLNEQIEFIKFIQNGKEYKYRFPKVNETLFQIIKLLEENNFRIFVISASLELLVQQAAFEWFGIDTKNVAGMRLKTLNDEIFADEIIDIITIGAGKVDALKTYFNVQNPFVAAGDSISDLELLNSVPENGSKLIVGKNDKLFNNIENVNNLFIIN